MSVPDKLDFLAGGGEMGERICAFDWAGTPVGPVEGWSPALKMLLRIMLASRFPHILWWGSHYIQFYNDAYRPVLGVKHPHPGLGRPGGSWVIYARRSILDDLGIIPAMNWWLCREYQKTYSHITVEEQIGVSEQEVPDALKTPIFRISQEAMNNISKYSKASHLNLSLRKEDAKILLTIQDNGQGFDPSTVRKGMGLSTMRERAQLSGGTFHLESATGKGTIIRVSWPV